MASAVTILPAIFRDGCRISIKGAINSENEHTRGKNENAVWGFVISELARLTLNQQRELCPDSDTVFFIPSITTYRHRWTRYCESNGIEHTTLYALRHTFVSIIKTLPEGEVKALVGHSRNMDTFGTYGYEIIGEGIKTASDVNDIFAALLRSQIA
ncbi:MAG: hypothetical protein HFE45_08400 [Oscillospiraceae bacterium]|jgi:integrase|nr:hypothetical protein [Oscillospiraceae bacterium]